MTSTSTVGLPRLSRISRPMMSTMAVMDIPVLFRDGGGVLQDDRRGEKGGREGSGTRRATDLRRPWYRPWEPRMSYVQKVLQPGEQVRYQAAIHWIGYVHGIAWLLAALIVRVVTPASWQGGLIMNAVMILLVGAGVYFLGRAWFDWWITEIAVTDRRV